MDDLIKALEQATEGSRELDADVCKVAFWQSHGYYGETDEHGEWFLYSHRTGGNPTPKERLPHYTTSLDAALTLVPDGYTGHLSFGDRGACHLLDLDNEIVASQIASTPALALCLAALKARGAIK